MYPLITFLLENAAYAGFALTWAAHFCTARSYKRTARMVRQQETAHPINQGGDSLIQ